MLIVVVIVTQRRAPGAEIMLLPRFGKGSPRPKFLFLKTDEQRGLMLCWSDSPGQNPAKDSGGLGCDAACVCVCRLTTSPDVCQSRCPWLWTFMMDNLLGVSNMQHCICV